MVFGSKPNLKLVKPKPNYYQTMRLKEIYRLDICFESLEQTIKSAKAKSFFAILKISHYLITLILN